MKDTNDLFITKKGLAIQSIAVELMYLKDGKRIPKIQEFANKLNVGNGTIQSALTFLVDEGAIELRSSGHLGTTLLSIDNTKLWRISGLGSILCTMPLPYSKRYEGLATALYDSFEKAGIPFDLAFQRGALSRIEGVIAGRFDLAVCSQMAAAKMQEEYPQLHIASTLGKHSYVGGHDLIMPPGSTQGIRDGLRVGVDFISMDQALMSDKLLKGYNIEWVACPYNQLIDKLLSGEIDATVLNSDELKEKHPHRNLKIIHLDQPNATNTKATIVCLEKNVHIKRIVSEIVQVSRIEEVQNQIMNNELLPKY